jgi:hypothetical protein
LKDIDKTDDLAIKISLSDKPKELSDLADKDANADNSNNQ